MKVFPRTVAGLFLWSFPSAEFSPVCLLAFGFLSCLIPKMQTPPVQLTVGVGGAHGSEQDPDVMTCHASPKLCVPVVMFFKYIIGLLLVVSGVVCKTDAFLLYVISGDISTDTECLLSCHGHI